MTCPFPVVHVHRLEPEHFPEDQLTVAVFGPGHGEAIVVGLPDGRLGVLDGCREREDPVLALLERCDATGKPLKRLAFVGFTHPHEDHYAGLGHLLERHRDRIDLWLDAPLCQRDGKALYEFVDKTRGGRSPGPDDWEQSALLQVVDEMSRVAHYQRGQYKHGAMDKLLWEGEWIGGHALELHGIGPCDADVHQGHLDLVAAIKALAMDRPVPGGIDPNYTSAALLIRWGSTGVLLTGDLLSANGGYGGWGVARAAWALKRHAVQVVKCAHHASEGAHDHELWSRIKPQLALVTPFKRAMTTSNGAKNPPRPENIAALSKDAHVVITSKPQWPIDAANPLPIGAGRDAPADPSPDETGARTSAIEAIPREGRSDLNNAVAVTLDAHGQILRVVLAGDADFYTAP